jgi:hypothetical protein
MDYIGRGLLDKWKPLLGDMPPNFTQAKKKFRKGALRMHPDKGGDPAEFRAISDAYAWMQELDAVGEYELVYESRKDHRVPPVFQQFSNSYWENYEKRMNKKNEKHLAELAKKLEKLKRESERLRKENEAAVKKRLAEAKEREAAEVERNRAELQKLDEEADISDEFWELLTKIETDLFNPEKRRDQLFYWSFVLNCDETLSHAERQDIMQRYSLAYDAVIFSCKMMRVHPGFATDTEITFLGTPTEWLRKFDYSSYSTKGKRGFELASSALAFILKNGVHYGNALEKLWEQTEGANQVFILKDLPTGSMLRMASAVAKGTTLSDAQREEIVAEHAEILRGVQAELDATKVQLKEEQANSQWAERRLETEQAINQSLQTTFADKTKALKEGHEQQVQVLERKLSVVGGRKRKRGLAKEEKELKRQRASLEQQNAELLEKKAELDQQLAVFEEDKAEMGRVVTGEHALVTQSIVERQPSLAVANPEEQARRLDKLITRMWDYLFCLEMAEDAPLFGLRDGIRQALMVQWELDQKEVDEVVLDKKAAKVIERMKASLQQQNVCKMKTVHSRLTYVVGYDKLIHILTQVKGVPWIQQVTTATLRNTLLPSASGMIANILQLQRLAKLSEDGQVRPKFIQALLGISREHAQQYIQQLPKPRNLARFQGNVKCTKMIKASKKKPLRRCKKRATRGNNGALRCGYHHLQIKLAGTM